MKDAATKGVSAYIRQKGIPVSVISRETEIPDNALYRSLNELVRPLRADEFLAICSFLDKKPEEFKKSDKR